MTDKERLDKANQVLDELEKETEKKKAIGDDLKELDKKFLEVRTNTDDVKNNPSEVLKKINGILNKIDKKEGERSGINSTMKKLKVALISIIRGEGEFNPDQMTLEEFAQS